MTINLQEVGQEKVMPALQAALPGYEIDSWDTLRPEIRETLTTKLAFTTVFGLIVVFVASIGILNIQLMAVFERTREMGGAGRPGHEGPADHGSVPAGGHPDRRDRRGDRLSVQRAAAGWVGQVGHRLLLCLGMGEMTALMGDRIYPYVSPADVISRGIPSPSSS